MRRKISASLLAFMLVFQALSSGYLAPFTALASEPVASNTTETSEIASEPTEAELAAAKLDLENATQLVNDLFTDPSHKTIKAGLVDGVINTAEAAVNKLEEQTEKANLQALITEARAQVANVEAKAKEETEQVEAAEKAKAEEAVKEEKAAADVAEEIKEEAPAKEEPVKEETPAKEEAKEEEPVQQKAKQVKQSSRAAMAATSAQEPTSTESLTNTQLTSKVNMYLNKPSEIKNGEAVIGYSPNGAKLEEMPVDLSNPFYLLYELQLNKGTYNLGTEYTYTMELPTQFAPKATSGNLYGLNGSVVTYRIDGQKVSFNMVFDEETIEDLAEQNANISFFYAQSFSNEVINSQSLEETLVFKNGSETTPVVITVKKDETQKLVKNGLGNKGNEAADSIEWTIDVNNPAADLKAVKINDTLPAGLKAPTAIYKQEYTVDRTGKFINPVGGKEVVSTDLTNINLGDINKPYRISYTTDVEDGYKVGSKTFNNTAVLTYGDSSSITASKSLTFDYGVPISKAAKGVSPATQTATWEITFNGNYRDIVSGKNKVTDTMSSQLNHRFGEIKSVMSYEKGNSNGTDAKSMVTYSNGEFTFPEGNKKYVVTYTTKYDRITNNSSYTLTNEASYNGVNTGVKSQSVSQVGIQKNKTVNFNTKEITWKITLGTDGGTIPAGTVITDTYDEQLTIKDPQANILGNAVTYNDVAKDGKKSFSFTLSADAPINTTFTYVTKFDPNNLPSDNKFKNTVNASKTDFDMTANADVPINSLTQKNGQKAGVYNYLTNQIDWTVDVNYNLDDLISANVTDTWTDYQYYVDGSLKVYALDIKENQDDRITKGEDLAPTLNATTTNGNLVIPLPNGKTAYRITYSTQLGAEELSDGGAKDVLVSAVYNNKAVLNNGKPQELVADVKTPVNNMSGTELIQKYGEQNGDLASWQVAINKGRSLIQEGKILKDELTGSQYYDENSFVLKEKIYNANNSGSFTWQSIAIPSGSLKFTDENTKFELSLPKMSNEYLLQYNTIILADHNQTISNKVGLYDVTQVMKEHSKNVQVKWEESGGASSIPSGSGKLEFVKTAPSGKVLENVEFNIYSVASNGSKGPLVETVRTNEQGIAITEKKYKYKKYLVEEVAAPAGYKKNPDTVYTFGKLEGGKVVIPTLINEVDVQACTEFEVKIDLTDKEVNRVIVQQDNNTIASSLDRATQTVKVENLVGLDKSKPYTIELITTDNKKITVQSNALKYESVIDTTTGETIVKCSATITDSTVNTIVDACTTTTVTVTGGSVEHPVTKGKVVVYDKTGKVVDSKTLDTGKVVFNKFYNEKEYDIFVEVTGYKSIKVDLNGDCEVTVNVELSKACAEIKVTVKYDAKFIKDAKVQILDAIGTAQELNAAKETTVTTNADGQVIIPVKYATGDYKISVIASGYKYTPTDFSPVNCELIVDLNNANNSCTTYVIKVVGENGVDIKDSAYDKFRADSVFTLTSSALTAPIENVKIDQDGELAVLNNDGSLTKLDKAMLNGAEGEYVLSQTVTAAGFETLKPIKVTDLNDCTASVTINFSKTTEPTNPGITCPDFTVNYNGPANSEAEFKLVELVTDKDNKVTEVTVTDGIKVITDATTKKQTLDFATSSKPVTVLEDGEYKLVQTKAHPAYDLAEDTEFKVVEGVCQAELAVTNTLTLCSQDTVITVKDKDDKVITLTEETPVTVTVDGKKVSVTIKDGKVVVPKESITKGKETILVITLEDGRTTTVTLAKDRVECTVDAVVDVLNLCDKAPKISITTTGGKEIPAELVEKVTINGKEVKPTIENGKLVIPKNEVNPKKDTVITITLKDGNDGTVTIPKFSEVCDFTIIVKNVCDENPNITITTASGKEISAKLVEKVTINGKEVKPTIKNGKLVIQRTDVKQEVKNEVTVTLKDGNSGTVTIPVFSEDCDFTIVVKNACEEVVVKVTLDGKPYKNAKVTVENEKGKVVQTTKSNAKGKVIIKPEFANDKHELFVTVFEETKSFDLDHCVINANFFTEVAVDGDDETDETPNTNVDGDDEINETPNTNVDGDQETNGEDNINEEASSGNETPKMYNVYDENGNLIARNVKVGADGKIDLSHLPAGNYVLVSVDGKETIKMAVAKDNQLPQTGTQSIWLSTMAGLMLLALGALVIGRNRKKHA